VKKGRMRNESASGLERGFFPSCNTDQGDHVCGVIVEGRMVCMGPERQRAMCVLGEGGRKASGGPEPF